MCRIYNSLSYVYINDFFSTVDNTNRNTFIKKERAGGRKQGKKSANKVDEITVAKGVFQDPHVP